MHRLITWFFPEQASNVAPKVDSIVAALLALCGGVTMLVMALIGVFLHPLSSRFPGFSHGPDIIFKKMGNQLDFGAAGPLLRHLRLGGESILFHVNAAG